MKTSFILSAFTSIIALGFATPATPTVEEATVTERSKPVLFETLFCTGYNYTGLCLPVTSLDGECVSFKGNIIDNQTSSLKAASYCEMYDDYDCTSQDVFYINDVLEIVPGTEYPDLRDAPGPCGPFWPGGHYYEPFDKVISSFKCVYCCDPGPICSPRPGCCEGPECACQGPSCP